MIGRRRPSWWHVRRHRHAVMTALACVMLASAPTAARAQFELGLQDPAFDGAATPHQAAAGYRVMRRIGGSMVRLNAYWSAIAPTAPARTADASDPADPAYRWTAMDTAVRRGAAQKLPVLLMVSSAPAWAQGPGRPANASIGLGAWDPNAAMFGRFVRALAARYDGSFPDPHRRGATLPRVRYFEVWNEENLPGNLAAPNLIGEYRSLLTAGYRAIKSVRRDDRVAIGGLAPVSYLPPLSISPLQFAARLMCLRPSGGAYVRQADCRSAPFDIFAEHPYTVAVTPTVPAAGEGGVLIADLPKLRRLLTTAERLRTIARGPHPLWVTEWGWITDPPDRSTGDPLRTAARFVAYSMHEMWASGVSLVIWQEIHDGAANDLAGAGLETRAGASKPQLDAFAFPFIASVETTGGYAWGRLPFARTETVIVQRRTGIGWRRVATARPSPDGVFQARFAADQNGIYRAIAGDQTSLPYDSTPIPPRRTHRFDGG